MNETENRTAYLVEYSEAKGFFSPYVAKPKEYWSKKTLASRLNSSKYSVHSAVMVIIEDPQTVVIDE